MKSCLEEMLRSGCVVGGLQLLPIAWAFFGYPQNRVAFQISAAVVVMLMILADRLKSQI